MRGVERIAGLAVIVTGFALSQPAPGQDRSRGDELFRDRADPKRLEAAIAAFEAAGQHVMVMRACSQRLELHDDLEEKKEKLRFIDRGLKAGAAYFGTDEVDGALARLEKRHAEGLFWYAALYGRKTELASVFSQYGMAKKFRAMAERARDLDGTVYHGGPHRMLGNFYAEAPGLLGGDWDKAARELDRAVELAPDFLEGLVMRAQLLHVHRKDREAFRRDLKRVLEAKDDVLPDLVPEQHRQKAAAKKLLEREKELL